MHAPPSDTSAVLCCAVHDRSGAVQARGSFYKNLGCPECATASDAVAPHQPLCASAATMTACEHLTVFLEE